MMVTKPPGYLFVGGFTFQDINWACLFYPEHGSFITCQIIINTFSGILMKHARLDFIISYMLKWFTFHSDAEKMTWRRNYRLEFDFAANYAELNSNFFLTMFIFIMFPVIGVVSWACSICRFLSDRHAMMNIYAVSHASPDLHREPINNAIFLSIFSPLACVVYRIIQLGNKSVEHLGEATFLAPLIVTILYFVYLMVSFLHFRFHWFDFTGNKEDEEDDIVNTLSKVQNEYDPILIQTEGLV
jgi:hypothetical protein